MLPGLRVHKGSGFRVSGFFAERWKHSISGLYRDNGKENGNYYSILGLYWDRWARVSGLGFEAAGLGFRVWRILVKGLGFRA